jgi:hypothetical protein
MFDDIRSKLDPFLAGYKAKFTKHGEGMVIPLMLWFEAFRKGDLQHFRRTKKARRKLIIENLFPKDTFAGSSQ